MRTEEFLVGMCYFNYKINFCNQHHVVKVVALGLGDKKTFSVFFSYNAPNFQPFFYFLLYKNCTFSSKVKKEKQSMENKKIIQNVCYPIV